VTPSTTSVPLRRTLIGSAVAFGVIVALSAVMLALRSQLADATVALVLVVPVVVGVVIGGLWSGTVAVVIGTFVFDWAFIKPYYTLTIGSPRDWVALGVYVVVVLLVAQVVDRMRTAEQAARNRESDTHRLMTLSELLIEDRPLGRLLAIVVSSVRDAFGCKAVVVLMPRDGQLQVVAASGRDLTPAELERIAPQPGIPTALTSRAPARQDGEVEEADIETLVLASPGRPVGLLALVGSALPVDRREMASAFANYLAVAIERSELQANALRVQVLEEVDRLRDGLVAAVSHDLRTPLTTIKASASALLELGEGVANDDRQELLGLIDVQADRLGRLVTNLLDMSRIETGALAVSRQALDVADIVNEAIASLRPLVAEGLVEVSIADDTPLVDADHVLTLQVLVNLLENAVRYAPAGSSVRISAGGVTEPGAPNLVEIAVADDGPGIPEEDRASALGLGRPSRPSGAGAAAGGSGIGLTIARSFAEVQGGRLSIDSTTEIGARIILTLPAFA
jgi:two-component system sensor histidine kinase KdpD